MTNKELDMAVGSLSDTLLVLFGPLLLGQADVDEDWLSFFWVC